uniref:Peptidase M1 alanyl aminopeptidase C-terminal domain-containing protein n=1 Tax=Tanacetum cinerariifolium TaxID=118510 RepID=A0A699SCD5_TANCI|nr:hypothetical protein [Tanacetum cinerariifolium]
MVAEMLSLPGEAYLTEISEVADVDAIHAAREFAHCVRGRVRALRSPRAAEHCAVLPDADRQARSTDGGHRAVRQRRQHDRAPDRAGRAGQLAVRRREGQRAGGVRRELQGQRVGHGSVVQRSGRQHLARWPGPRESPDATPRVYPEEPEQGACTDRRLRRAEPDQLSRGGWFGLSLPGGPGH